MNIVQIYSILMHFINFAAQRRHPVSEAGKSTRWVEGIQGMCYLYPNHCKQRLKPLQPTPFPSIYRSIQGLEGVLRDPGFGRNRARDSGIQKKPSRDS